MTVVTVRVVTVTMAVVTVKVVTVTVVTVTANPEGSILYMPVAPSDELF